MGQEPNTTLETCEKIFIHFIMDIPYTMFCSVNILYTATIFYIVATFFFFSLVVRQVTSGARGLGQEEPSSGSYGAAPAPVIGPLLGGVCVCVCLCGGGLVGPPV